MQVVNLQLLHFGMAVAPMTAAGNALLPRVSVLLILSYYATKMGVGYGDGKMNEC